MIQNFFSNRCSENCISYNKKNLNGYKIVDKITSAGKAKCKEKEVETNKRQEIYIPTEKRKQIIDDLRLF